MTVSIQNIAAAQARLQMIHLQLGWLEREMIRLGQELSQEEQTQTASVNFASLRGVWRGIELSTEEVAAVRISVAKDLL